MKRYRLARHATPLGEMLLASEGGALTGAWFFGQRHFAAHLEESDAEYADAEPLAKAKAWLNAYFAGQWPVPTPLPALAPNGTLFQQAVWRNLLRIPYGSSHTYGQIAESLRLSGHPTSPRAVGSAVGRNPISIIIPCHRVLGASGSATGYAAGIPKKLALLHLEAQALPTLRKF